MTRGIWRRTGLLLLLAIVLAGTLPVLISANRFRARLIASLEHSLGRKVEVGAVRFSLLGAPALEAEDVTVAEDPRFGNEPFLRARRLRCEFAILSILQRRLSLASLSFDSPSINLVRSDRGEWNLSSLLKREEHSAERRRGRPSGLTLNLDSARVNFKWGPNKLVHMLDNLSAKLRYSPESQRWELQSEFSPLRTDMSLAEIGTIVFRAKGEMTASHWRDWPFQFEAEWKKSRLSDIGRLFFGHDRGWRGLPQVRASGQGTLRRVDFQAGVQLSDLHAVDLLSGPETPVLGLEAKGTLDLAVRELALETVECRTERSKALLSGRVAWGDARDRQGRPTWELRFDSDQVHLADFAAWLPGFRANVDAALKTDAVARVQLRGSGSPTRWQGSISVPASNLETSAVGFAGDSSLTKLRVGEIKAQLRDSILRVSTVVLRWPRWERGELKVRGVVNFLDPARPYRLEVASDHVPLEGLVALEQALGIEPPRPIRLSGSAALSLRWRGQLQHPAGAAKAETWPEGKLLLDGIQVSAPGMRGEVQVEQGRAEFRQGEARIFLDAARLAKANWQGRLHLYSRPKREWRFILSADHLDLAALDETFNPRYAGRLLFRSAQMEPFSQFLAKADARWFDSVRANGRLTAGSVEVGPVKMEDLRATVNVSGRQIRLDPVTLRAYGGQFEGWHRADFRPSQSGPSYHVQGRFDRVLAESLLARPGEEGQPTGGFGKPAGSRAKAAMAGRSSPQSESGLPVHGSWLAGLLDGTLTLKTAGSTHDELIENLTGSVHLNWDDGRITHFDLLRAMDVAAKPESRRMADEHLGFTAFRTATAHFLVADRRLEFRSLSLAVEGTELELTGTVGFDGKLSLWISPKSPIAARGEVLRAEGRRTTERDSSAVPALPLSPMQTFQLTGTLAEPRLTISSVASRPGR